MKIVIDIEEGKYNDLMEGRYPLHCGGFIKETICNGKPLPKKHGDLIDIDSKITVAIKNGLKVTTVRELLKNNAVRPPETVIEAENGGE